MSVDYSKLAPGQEISRQSYSLDADAVSRYVEAVGDRSWLASQGSGQGLAPPMVVAALSLRGVLNDLAIPGGTIHLGQELEFCGAVRVGETLDCKATLQQQSIRGDFRFMVVKLHVDDSSGRKVMGGNSTIMVPVG